MPSRYGQDIFHVINIHTGNIIYVSTEFNRRVFLRKYEGKDKDDLRVRKSLI